MISPTRLAELQHLVVRLQDARTRVMALGEPARLAGDPAAIRRLAEAHRSSADVLRKARELGHARARQVTEGRLWEGSASSAFTDHCRNVHDGIDDLASSHENLAGTLHGVATEAGRLNSETLTVIAAIQTWLTVAAQAEVRRDPAETEALLHQGRLLFSELRRLLHETERFTAEVAHRVSTDLRFVVRRAAASTPVVRQARPARASPSAGRREPQTRFRSAVGREFPAALAPVPAAEPPAAGPPPPAAAPSPEPPQVPAGPPPGPVPPSPVASPPPSPPEPFAGSPLAAVERLFGTVPWPHSVPLVTPPLPGRANPGAGTPNTIPEAGPPRVPRVRGLAGIAPGSTRQEVIDHLPQRLRYRGRPTRDGNGVRYVDPQRPGEQVRIMSRDPGALDPLHQGPYAVIDTKGQKRWIPLRGNPVL